MKLREMKWLAHDHTSQKSHGSNSGSLILWSVMLWGGGAGGGGEKYTHTIDSVHYIFSYCADWQPFITNPHYIAVSANAITTHAQCKELS